MGCRLFVVLSTRIREERGFSLVEVVVAMGVILVSLTMLATTALVGFKGAATARDRQAATGLADQLVEQVRGLPFPTVSEGMRTSDLAGDIPPCGSTYCYGGETIVHTSEASTAPLYPHRATVTISPTTFTRSVYLTNVSGSTNIYRLTINVSWTAGASTSSIQTQTLLSQPEGSGDASTQTTTAGSSAFFFGTGSSSPGNVVITPNATVYNSGVGITGLTSGVWSLGDSVAQTMYALDAGITQGQVTKVNGQSTLTTPLKRISGTLTEAGGATTVSAADDDATTADVTATSAPTGISQNGPSLSLSGGGNSLSLNGYSETTTTTTTTTDGTVTRRSASSATSNTGSITIGKPSGLEVDDFMLLQLSYQGACMATPSGWTSVRCDTNSSGGNSVTSSVFYRWATASDVSSWNGSFSTGAGNASGTVGGIIAFTGVSPSTPVDNSGSGSGTGTTATAPAISVSVNKTRIVALFAARKNTSVTPNNPGSGTPGATDWSQAWGAVSAANGGRNYAVSTTGLSTTASGTTIGSPNTQSSTFEVARTLVRMGLGAGEYSSGTQSWQIRYVVSAMTTPYEMRLKLQRRNSSGVVQSESSYGTVRSSTGTYTDTISWDAGTWSANDQLALVWEHRRESGTGNKNATIDANGASYVDAPTDDLRVGGGSSDGNKQAPGGGNNTTSMTASLGQSTMWVAQMVALRPNPVTTTTTTTTTGDPGTETGSTVSTTTAASTPVCGSPAQTDGRACAYATQSYAVPAGVTNAFLTTTVNLSGYSSGVGSCKLYAFNPPSTSPTNYAYGRRATTSGDGKLVEDVKRYYGTHTFGDLCSGTGKPSGWPGYFVRFDAGTSAAQATAQSGVSSSAPSASTAGTIRVWNGSGTTSFAVPTGGTWSTSPTPVDYTTGGYRYQISATLASGATYTTDNVSGTKRYESKAIVGAPVIGTITYKLTDQNFSPSRVLIDVTMTIDLGSLIANANYTEAAA